MVHPTLARGNSRNIRPSAPSQWFSRAVCILFPAPVSHALPAEQCKQWEVGRRGRCQTGGTRGDLLLPGSLGWSAAGCGTPLKPLHHWWTGLLRNFTAAPPAIILQSLWKGLSVSPPAKGAPLTQEQYQHGLIEAATGNLWPHSYFNTLYVCDLCARVGLCASSMPDRRSDVLQA